MIAAARRRIGAVFLELSGRLRKWSRTLDRAGNRGLERTHPRLRGASRRASALARGGAAFAGPRLRPVGHFFLRAMATLERSVRRSTAAAIRGATALSALITPQRAVAAVILASGACLVVSQFIDYRGVEVGQPGYAALGGVAEPPTVEVRTAGQAHAYLLVPLGLLGVALGLLAAFRDRRRLGLLAAGLGLVSLLVILAVDLPRGLDAGSQTSRFAGATAVLEDGFYAELAAAAGLVLAGLLYYARPCRIPINSSGRAASARRRRPRRPGSSRARAARRA
jgi:hypothetical protein